MHELLFVKFDLAASLRQWQERLKKEIESIPTETLLNTNMEEWCDHFESKFRLDVPVLLEERIETSQSDAKINVSGDPRWSFSTLGPNFVSGTKYTFHIPFDGDGDLFHFKPSTFSLNPPRGEVSPNELLLVYSSTDHSTSEVKKDFEGELSSVQNYLACLKKDAENYNQSIRGNAQTFLSARREKLLKDDQSATSFGFPVRKRKDAKNTYSVPTQRKNVPSVRPKPQKGTSQREPVLDMETYDNILSIISNMNHVIERSPRAFVKMGEEDLRTHFLVQLNGQYEGKATGETFNYDGKTDILIREEDRNIFIAECKFWHGAEQFKQTIDQLLGYATWRDTKLALLLFNRNKDFTAVVGQVPDIVRSHSRFARDLPYQSESGCRSIMRHRDDDKRELILTVLAFDVPV